MQRFSAAAGTAQKAMEPLLYGLIFPRLFLRYSGRARNIINLSQTVSDSMADTARRIGNLCNAIPHHKERFHAWLV
jgi:hypothetical protein